MADYIPSADDAKIIWLTNLNDTIDGYSATLGRCKPVSVICPSSLQLHPFGVRRSEGERSEPSAAEPQGVKLLRARKTGRGRATLVPCWGVDKHIQHQTRHDPPHRS